MDGQCLTGYAAGPNGWSVWTAACDGTFSNTDQLWYVWPADNPGAGPVADINGRVLEPDRGDPGSDGARVEIWDNQGQPNQQWNLVYVG